MSSQASARSIFATRMHWETPSKDEWLFVDKASVPFFVQRVRKAYQKSFGCAISTLGLVKLVSGHFILRKEAATAGKSTWVLRFGADTSAWIIVLLDHLEVAVTEKVDASGSPELVFVL